MGINLFESEHGVAMQHQRTCVVHSLITTGVVLGHIAQWTMASTICAIG